MSAYVNKEDLQRIKNFIDYRVIGDCFCKINGSFEIHGRHTCIGYEKEQILNIIERYLK